MSKTVLARKYCLLSSTFSKRLCTRARKLTNSEVIHKRNELFGREKARQVNNISRVEKIQVEHVGPPENCTLLMNKGLSTPFNCAMHIQELLMHRSVIALVNGQHWDMHRPLTRDCQLQFLHFKDEQPELVNNALWRTGSFILGYVLENAFKDDFYVELCHFPRPDVSSGSFLYDVDLDMKSQDWKPTSMEFTCLSRIGSRLQYEDKMFEPLDIDASLALEMFEDNRFKVQQIPQIAAGSHHGNDVTVYRMGSHIDITRGPLIASTELISRFSVSAMHDIESSDYGKLKRVQGLIMPKQLPIHYWTYEFLTQQSEQLNRAPIPSLHQNRPVELYAKNGS